MPDDEGMENCAKGVKEIIGEAEKERRSFLHGIA